MSGPVVFTAPSQMQSIASCRAWNIGEIPPGGRPIVVDLRRWRYVTPTPVAGLLATLGRWTREGSRIELLMPAAPYPNRMLQTVGLAEAIATFATVIASRDPSARVRRYHPLLRAGNFKTVSDVEEIGSELIDEFGSSSRVTAPLNQEAYVALSEAANNAVEHSESPEGGFALAQLRERRPATGRSWFIEIAIADGGQGIAASLREPNDREAIVRALDEGVSRTGDPLRGFGLAELERLVQHPRRELVIHSGHGIVRVTEEGRRPSDTANRFPGTLLTISIPAGREGPIR